MNSIPRRLAAIPLARVLLIVLASSAAARAQDAPEPGADWSPPGPQTAVVASPASLWVGRNTTSLFSAPSGEAAGRPVPLQCGPIIADPHPAYSIFYDTGILASPGHPVSTTLQSFSPGVLLSLGPQWTLDYTPTWEWYSNPLFQHTLDHVARLQGSVAADDWTLGLIQGYSRSSEPLVETGRQTPEEAVTTDIKATRGYGSRTFIELGLEQVILNSPVIPDSREWSTLDWVHQPLSPQWDAAVGGGAGYVSVNPGSDMDCIRPEARLTWKPSPRLAVDLRGGVEDRAFLGSREGRLVTPIFSVSSDYQAGESTKVTLAGGRDVEVGYAEGQVDRVTTLSLGLQQRVLQHFFIGAAVGREEVAYLSTSGNPADLRNDGSTTYQFSLGTVLFRRLSLSAQYSSLRNASSAAGFAFSSGQTGLTVQYRY